MAHETYRATIQCRTTLDQAGQIAGLAGELDVTESEIMRRLLAHALEPGAGAVLKRLRGELAQEREAQREAQREFDALSDDEQRRLIERHD